MERKNSRLRKVLFCGIVLFDVLLNLIPTYHGSFIYSFFEFDAFRSFSLTLSNAFNTIVFGIIIIISGIKNRRTFSLVLIITLLMVFSSFANFRFNSLLQIFGFFIVCIGMFCTGCFNYDARFIKSISLLIVLWVILPVVYLPFASAEQIVYMFGSEVESTISTFCGFGFHRNDYGFFAGLSILFLIILDYPKWFKLPALVVIAIGLFLAQSRSSLFGVLIVSFIYKWKDISRNRRFILLLLGSFLLVVLFFLSIRQDTRIFSESYGRESINLLFWQLIKRSPLFGYGGATMAYSSYYPEGTPGHNFIIQSAADYGIIAALLFCLFLIDIYKFSSNEGRAVLSFLCIIGFFQPYLTLAMPKMYSLIAFLFVILLNNRNHIIKRIHYTSRAVPVS